MYTNAEQLGELRWLVKRSQEPDSADDVSIQENETQLRRNLSRQTSPRIIREQERFQGLLRELSTPVKGEQAEVDDNDVVGSV
ncbi:unnamed protein product [Rhizophagus irregularis]|uniref:Uncharacterized protein n=1 Tax=Rhizophagus irregularis TaxID=588596 RepID=A0A916EJK6_9GLOM|nr:unnamed protein product [Rhizophagus irregularis]